MSYREIVRLPAQGVTGLGILVRELRERAVWARLARSGNTAASASRTPRSSRPHFVATSRLVRLVGLFLIGVLAFADGSAVAQDDDDEEDSCIEWGDECTLCLDDECEECDGKGCVRISCDDDDDDDDEGSGVCPPE